MFVVLLSRHTDALPTGQGRRSRVYHCVSRVVERHFIFQTSGHGSVEAQRFVQLMRRLEAFSGIRVLTYALMSNHFHLLCEVPEPKALSEAEVLERIEAGYGPARLETLRQELLAIGSIRMVTLRSSACLMAIADGCVLTPRIIVTAVTPRLLARVVQPAVSQIPLCQSQRELQERKQTAGL